MGKIIKVKSSQESEYRERDIDDVFLEALALSAMSKRSEDALDAMLLTMINRDSNVLKNIYDGFKYSTLKHYDYSVL